MSDRPEVSNEVWSIIPGSNQLLTWFGHYPDFHDAEVLEIRLNRQSSSGVKLYTATPDLGSKNVFLLEKDAIVTFVLDGLADVQLSGFSVQNVITEASIKRIERGLLRLDLIPCLGIAGHLDAKSIRVELMPLYVAPTSRGLPASLA